MKLIVGLGNPGDKYKNNRHNIGFKILDDFVAHECHERCSYKNKFNAEILEYLHPEGKVIYVKPMTFMNKSGDVVQGISKFYDIKHQDILVIHDEIDLMIGRIKDKFGGGLAGHNGLKSITQRIGTRDFWRIRIGIGRPENKDDISDYVLSNLGKMELKKILIQYDEIFGYIHIFLSNPTLSLK